jgi:hypothetical protein
MARIAKPTMRPAEEAFVVTVGVSHSNKDADCANVLRLLARHGYHAGPTSDDAILTLAEQVELNRELADNDPTED